MRTNDYDEIIGGSAELTDDGFCPLCNDYHSECECMGYWIRETQYLRKQNKKHNNDYLESIHNMTLMHDAKIEALESVIMKLNRKGVIR